MVDPEGEGLVLIAADAIAHSDVLQRLCTRGQLMSVPFDIKGFKQYLHRVTVATSDLGVRDNSWKGQVMALKVRRKHLQTSCQQALCACLHVA